jgi:hypothetical protein
MKFIYYLSLSDYNKHGFGCWFLNFIHDRLNENLFEIIIKNISIEQKFNFKYTDLFESHFKLFWNRSTINAGKHLHLAVVDKDQLICTFASTIPIDFAHIDLCSLSKTEHVLSEKEILKIFIAFDPPITPKPIERIVFPDDEDHGNSNLMKIFFMIVCINI